eukprot:7872352-Alexandrium_andersonii.AAC.2
MEIEPQGSRVGGGRQARGLQICTPRITQAERVDVKRQCSETTPLRYKSRSLSMVGEPMLVVAFP